MCTPKQYNTFLLCQNVLISQAVGENTNVCTFHVFFEYLCEISNYYLKFLKFIISRNTVKTNLKSLCVEANLQLVDVVVTLVP